VASFAGFGANQHFGASDGCTSLRPGGSLNEIVQFVIQHGYSVLFAWVLAEQLGMPIPSMPMLLAAGAVSGTHQLYFSLALAMSVVAAVVSDVHGNFIVNEGGATAQDVLNLIEIVKQRVKEERGIDLETEVQIIGE